jgi:hypothetical protein
MAKDDAAIYRAAMRLMGYKRQYSDPAGQSARSRATISKHKPWLRGRIGKIEKRISRHLYAGAVFSNGELTRLIYCDPKWDQNFRMRPDGATTPKPKSWQYLQVRKAAPTFADCLGRSDTLPGHPYMWRLRKDLTYWFDIRREKAAGNSRRRKN